MNRNPRYKKGDRLFWLTEGDDDMMIKSVIVEHAMILSEGVFYAVAGCYAAHERELFRTEEEVLDSVRYYMMKSNLMSFAQ